MACIFFSRKRILLFVEKGFRIKSWEVLSLGQWLSICRSKFSSLASGISVTEWLVVFLLTRTNVNRLGIRTVSDAAVISCLLSPFAIATYPSNLDWSNLLFPSVFQELKVWWCLTCLLFIKWGEWKIKPKMYFWQSAPCASKTNITAFRQYWFPLMWCIHSFWLAF